MASTHELGDLVPVDGAIKSQRQPTVLADVRRLEEPRILEEHRLHLLLHLEAEYQCPGMMRAYDRKRVLAGAKCWIVKRGCFAGIGQREADRSKPLGDGRDVHWQKAYSAFGSRLRGSLSGRVAAS